MAAETLLLGLIFSVSLSFTVLSKLFESPTACIRIQSIILYHHSNPHSFPFQYIRIFIYCLKYIKHQNRSISKMIGLIAFNCFVVCVDMMETTSAFKSWAFWSNDRCFDVHPFSITIWVGHFFRAL